MAEALFRHMLKCRLGEQGEKFTVTSCGTAGFEGVPATDEAVETMHEEGIHLSYHRSKAISAIFLEDADIVFVMSNRHKDFIDSFFPSYSRKTHLVKAYALRRKRGLDIPIHDLDIPDPIGKKIEAYRDVYRDLKYIFGIILDEWEEENS